GQDADPLRPLEREHAGAIRDDQREPGAELVARLSVEERLEVAAPPGDEDGDPLHRRKRTAGPSPRATTWPTIHASPSSRSSASASAGATKATMPSPRLNVRSMSASSTPASRFTIVKIGGSNQLRRSSSTASSSGSARGTLSTRPPPVMWASAWIR